MVSPAMKALAQQPAELPDAPRSLRPLQGLCAGSTAHSVYPQRHEPEEAPWDAWTRVQWGRLRHKVAGAKGPLTAAVALANTLETEARSLSQAELQAQLQSAAAIVWREGLDEHRPERQKDRFALAACLALIREAALRSLGMRPFDTQLLGAACLVTGRLAEMQTGEGKTLTAGLGAAIIASAGVPVHVATVNDYLAERDAHEVTPLLAYLRMRVGHVIGGMDLVLRRRAYACDVTYCTSNELVFDYLKDRVQLGHDTNQARHRFRSLLGGTEQPLLLRGLCFAIVDEADSVFIDEARTPLILSDNAGPPADGLLYVEALQLARELQAGTHFQINLAHRELHITPQGRQQLTERSVTLGRDWAIRSAREHLVGQALRALHLFHADQHYIVKDDKVHIVDEHTGRVLPGRIWEGGLHQIIEAKEGCAYSDQSRTMARITYQRFFRRYLSLSGMTGTAKEVRPELWSVYGLETVVVPTHKPSQRRHLPVQCVRTQAAKWVLVADQAQALLAQGRPVLIGTRSVEASETLSRLLAERGLPHQLLNARQDADEAELVATAAGPGVLTVATNMAGRGTDIKLTEQVKLAGGLHVILTEFHDASRVDRQLFGRAARQGDPGSVQAIVSLDDALFAHHAPSVAGLIQRSMGPADKARSDSPLCAPKAASKWAVAALKWLAQRHAEGLHARTRASSIEQDKRMETMLSFSGKH
jgi:preprotein translocase subunit SecA